MKNRFEFEDIKRQIEELLATLDVEPLFDGTKFIEYLSDLGEQPQTRFGRHRRQGEDAAICAKQQTGEEGRRGPHEDTKSLRRETDQVADIAHICT